MFTQSETCVDCGLISLGGVKIIALLLISFSADAGQVKLAWDDNSEPYLGGYKVFFGEVSGQYSVIVDVGDITNYTFSGLLADKTYYFNLKAYDVSGTTESGFAGEISIKALLKNQIMADGFD